MEPAPALCLNIIDNDKILTVSNTVGNINRNNPEPVTDELYIRRLTVDEALYKLDQYLNDAFMAGLRQVRVIHGKGTGTLRQVVRKELSKHPLVKAFRQGEYGEGGAGVTIVDLS